MTRLSHQVYPWPISGAPVLIPVGVLRENVMLRSASPSLVKRGGISTSTVDEGECPWAVSFFEAATSVDGKIPCGKPQGARSRLQKHRPISPTSTASLHPTDGTSRVFRLPQRNRAFRLPQRLSGQAFVFRRRPATAKCPVACHGDCLRDGKKGAPSASELHFAPV